MSMAHVASGFLMESPAPWRADWLWGCPLIVITVIIHVLGLGLISQRSLRISQNIMERRHRTPAFAVVMGATTLVLTLMHGIETSIWAVAYYVIGALPDPKAAMLYSFGAMTTYGHQNLFLEDRWRLLGPIEALNGWLLFGLSTAFLFWMIQEVSPGNRTVH